MRDYFHMRSYQEDELRCRSVNSVVSALSWGTRELEKVRRSWRCKGKMIAEGLSRRASYQSRKRSLLRRENNR
jgi:hypothetical protein